MADPRWRRGAAWGVPRSGHPEGAVAAHVADVLANLDRADLTAPARSKLRLVAIFHDTFKAEVDQSQPKTGDNHHAVRARRFAETYVTDLDVLELVELHDEAYNAWVAGHRRGRWGRAEERAGLLVERLGPRLELFLAFYRADNATGDKQQEPVAWFEHLVAALPAGD